MTHRKATAVYVITKHGLPLGLQLLEQLPQSDLYVSQKIPAPDRARLIPCQLPLTPLLEETFFRYDCHVFVISVGAVVRMIAPYLRDKKRDPAVVCVDDAGRYAISLLSGHVGRGNEWTQTVARILEAEAVITTASDVQGTLTVDILGRELGWCLDDPDRHVTLGCAAVVNERPVLIIQETGEPHFWPLDKVWPPGVQYTRSWETVKPEDWEMLLMISDRDLERIQPEAYARGIVYRPKSLVLGIGCDRGIPVDRLERGILQTLREFQLSPRSVGTVASLDLKADELGLLELCKRYGWQTQFYSAEDLKAVAGVERPSATVASHTGTPSVSEAACLKAAGTSRLLVPKQKYREPDGPEAMTVAVARRDYPNR